MKTVAILFAILTISVPCAAATITVNWDGTGDYTTIQAGINAAVSGVDTVEVAEGTYVENINFGGKDIVLTSIDSTDPNIVRDTIIDGGGSDHVVEFAGTETSSCELRGFTITNGNASDGGGIYGRGANATISNCIITNNTANDDGGGLYWYDGAITDCVITGNTAKNGGGIKGCDGAITNCTISGNSAETYGGGLYWCGGVITNCIITNNTIRHHGGGMSRCHGSIINCTISGNTSNWNGGGMYECDGNITNCIIWGNSAVNSGDQLYRSPTRYSCIQDWSGGGTGNISSNPDFVGGGDYHLQPGSPCIDAGINDPNGWGLTEFDLDGNPRLLDGDYDGQLIVDMGAYESPASTSPVIGISKALFGFVAPANGPNPDDQILTITNWGQQTLNWQITEDCDWLTVTPMAGSSVDANDITDVTLSVDITGLADGAYTCDLTIADPCAMNSPQTVNVNLGIGADVPYLYPTIQSAINAAINGDTIIVAPGTYYENINFNGKNIVLTSIDPTDPNVVRDTIIDGGGSGHVVEFSGTETSSCELTGFTITNGYASGDHPNHDGGGINGDNTYATISNCVITSNSADWGGGGLYRCNGTTTNCTITENSSKYGGGLSRCNGVITNCTITGNSAETHGGGLQWCVGSITNCTITGNTAKNGGGIKGCDGAITNCTISGNSATNYGGGLAWCDGVITNCIIWGNSAGSSGDQQLYNSRTPSYSCIQDWAFGGEGNISSNPDFVSGGDYHLQASSPCIDAGTNTPSGGLPLWDIEGVPRPLDGDDDVVFVTDMGVYEYWTLAGPFIRVSAHEFYFLAFNNGSNPSPQVLTISNDWTGTVNWEIIEDCSWLTVAPMTGSSTGESDDVILSVDITALWGNYNCQLTVSDTNAVNSPQIVNVTLNIQGAYIQGKGFYPTIQSAIDAAIHGDTIIVGPGTYYENINFNGKNIILTSTDPDDFMIVTQTIIHGQYSGSTVTFEGSEDPNCILEGFTITGGYGSLGGGVKGNNSQARISKCYIRHNSADLDGGGIYNFDGRIENCIIAKNRSWDDGGGLVDCDGTIKNCTIINNKARDDGGGLYQCNGTIVNCIIWANYRGWNWQYQNSLDSCSTPSYSCYPEANGNGNINLDPLLSNSGYLDPNGTPEDPSDDHWVRDYHLKSEAGRWEPDTLSWMTDGVTSPCIDAGEGIGYWDPNGTPSDPNDDFWVSEEDNSGEELWPDGGRINMGAYGGTAQASMSLNIAVGNPADFNKDDSVDGLDLNLLADKWLLEEILLAEDINRNNFVDMIDVALFAQEWLWEQ